MDAIDMKTTLAAYEPPMPDAAKAQAPQPSPAPPLTQMAQAKAIPMEILAETLLGYGFKATEENKAMLRLMVENGIPLTKENITRMNQAKKLTGTAEKALFMMKNNIRMTEANANILEGFASKQTKITAQLEKLVTAAGEIKDPVLKAKVQEILAGEKGEAAAKAEGAQEPSPPQTAVKLPAAPAPQNLTQPQPAPAVPTQTAPQSPAQLQTAPTPQAAAHTPAALTQPQTAPASPPAAPQNPAQTQTAAQIPTQTQAPILPAQVPSQIPAAQAQPLAAPPAAQIPAQPAATSQNPAAQTQTAPQIPPQTPTQPSTQSPLPPALLFPLENSDPAAVARYVAHLREAAAQIETALAVRETPDAARVLTEARALGEQLDFAQQIRNQIFVQLPIVYDGRQSHAELHVYKDAKKSGGGDADSSSALIALDTANLGHFETYVQKSASVINCQFRLESDEITRTVRANIHRLGDALRESGYTLNFSFLPQGEPYSVLSTPKSIENPTAAPEEISHFDKLV